MRRIGRAPSRPPTSVAPLGILLTGQTSIGHNWAVLTESMSCFAPARGKEKQAALSAPPILSDLTSMPKGARSGGLLEEIAGLAQLGDRGPAQSPLTTVQYFVTPQKPGTSEKVRLSTAVTFLIPPLRFVVSMRRSPQAKSASKTRAHDLSCLGVLVPPAPPASPPPRRPPTPSARWRLDCCRKRRPRDPAPARVSPSQSPYSRRPRTRSDRS